MARRRCRGAGAAEQMSGGARASVAAAAARVGAEGVGDPICRAAGHPWRAGRAQGARRGSQAAGAAREEEGRGGKERCQVGPTG
jgi:hypothetical protein